MGLIGTIPHLSNVAAHAPWPRVIVDDATWSGIARDLAAGRWTLVSLWAEQSAVHMALFDEKAGEGLSSAMSATASDSRQSARIIRRRSGSSVRSAISMDSSRKGSGTCGRGSISAPGT